MSKKLIAAAMLLGFAAFAFAGVEVTPEVEKLHSGWNEVEQAGGGVSWFSAPKETPNGWYYMYDNTEPGPPFDQPLPSIPTYADTVHEGGNKMAPYNDDTYQYSMPDSFWYYGNWHTPGNPLYISPDGWVSFDNAAADQGYPDPPAATPKFPQPDEPNDLIAPLWQDHDPTRDAEPSDVNRVYYLYAAPQLWIEWYQVEGEASGHEYTFQLNMTLGGQDRLTVAGECGVIFSTHFIHFIYEDQSHGWDAEHDPPVVGIEDYQGTHGITYGGTLTNGRRIRSGYKMIFKHDVAPVAFLSPGSMVLRWTRIEPEVVVGNIGQETEHFVVTLSILDDGGDEVYNHNLGAYDLLPGERDTAVAPCWEPGEIGETYTKVLYTQLERDECHYNDTLEVESFVHCDDTFRYDWNFGDWMVGWGISKPLHFLTFYPVDGGVLATGGQSYIYQPGTGYDPPEVSLWEPTTGCGATDNAHKVGMACAPSLQAGWNIAEFEEPGYFAKSGTPGNIFAGHSSCGSYYTGYMAEVGLYTWPGPHPCYYGSGPGRGAYISSGSMSWGSYTGSYYTAPIELFVHLGFGPFPLSPAPAPPCYYDNPHDLTAIRMEKPNIEWVQAEKAITPEIAIANIGRQAEPDAGFFPVKFMAVEQESGDTTFVDSTLIDEIGWLGDPGDDPDTLFVPIEAWTPDGKCVEGEDPFMFYELIGLVRLGEVGPDNSDHCPYNDTVRREVTSLWEHDVGVTALEWPEEPDEDPDEYYPGSEITATVTVENFGFNEEHDVEVHLEVMDADSNVLLWHNEKSIAFLNWRGNTIGDPYTIDLTFPTYTVENDHHQTIEARTELTDDMCPANDDFVRHINTGIEEIPAGVPFALEAITPNPFVSSTSISYGIPHATNVSLKVYDVSGKLVTTLVSGSQNPGRHTVKWSGTDDAGRNVAQGIYLVRMDAAEFSATKKVVLY